MEHLRSYAVNFVQRKVDWFAEFFIVFAFSIVVVCCPCVFFGVMTSAAVNNMHPAWRSSECVSDGL